MKWLKRIGVALAAVVVLFLVVVGPWPVYKDSKFAQASYYRQALADIEKGAALADITETPGTLRAGWAMRDMTPPVGTPMGGYGARPDGKRSKGVRDRLHARAIVLADGKDTVAIIGADMLITTPNIAELTWNKVKLAGLPLTENNILFTASHTHCGPGGFGPGLAAKVSAGTYDPKVPELISTAYADAIKEAYESMKPAKIAWGGVDAPELIRNRTRDAAVDSMINYLVVDKETGERCYVMRFSAHPTNYGSDMMDFTAEYPGEFMKAVQEQTGAAAMYLGGSLGSSSPRAPEAPSPNERIILLGQALAKKLLENMPAPEFKDKVDIASLGTPVGMPGMQMRPLSPKWRISPIFARFFGVPTEGWIQAVRIGDVVFVGYPYDFSGEVGKAWREEYEARGINLWPTSFCVTYCGYLSPDRHYNTLEKNGQLDYETGLMSWFGPNAEAYFKALTDKAVAGVTGGGAARVAAAPAN